MEKEPNFNDPKLIMNDEFFSLNGLSEILTCRICFEILIEPIECSGCRNMYCFECLQKWSNTKGG
jgi:hypothetical protein